MPAVIPSRVCLSKLKSSIVNLGKCVLLGGFIGYISANKWPYCLILSIKRITRLIVLSSVKSPLPSVAG